MKERHAIAAAGAGSVLVVDDDITTLTLTARVLEAGGFKTRVATDGPSALEAFDSERPDLVILDVEMPGMNGFALCQAIRERPHSVDLPIVMITGLDDTGSVLRAFECGATDFITKPITWAMLPFRLKQLLRANDDLISLRRSEIRNRALLEGFPDEVLLLDRTGAVVEGLGGMSGQSSLGHCLEARLPPDIARAARERLHTAMATGTIQALEYHMAQENRYFELRIVCHDEQSAIAFIRDVTQRRNAEQRVHRLAYYDALTGLPNRQQLLRDLRRAIRVANRESSGVAILYIDLDQFKRINDTLGHTVGDSLLKAAALRLEGCVRPTDHVSRAEASAGEVTSIARLGGDEFVVLINRVCDSGNVESIAERVRSSFESPLVCGTYQFVVTPSIGIATYPECGDSIEDLLRKADIAMFQAKAAGRNCVRNYSGTMTTRSLARLELEQQLREALDKELLEVHYQPKICLRTGAIVGAEALARWRNDERGWISPGQFIPIAEETGLIDQLGIWILRVVCLQIKHWRESGLSDLTVAVNISAHQFERTDIADTVMKAVWDAGIRADRLEIEITESVLARHVDATVCALEKLREYGVGIAIDDFGTGYSSLSYLKRFPINTLKIDQSFVKNLHVKRDDATICSAIIAMAQKLGMTVVAEGVECDAQADFLRSNDCDMAQGWLYGKAMAAKEFERFAKEYLINRPKAIIPTNR